MRRILGFVLIVFLFVMSGAVMAQDDDALRPDERIEATRFLPVESIIADGDLRVTDFSNHTAAIHLTTSVAVACQVVYGPTQDFGQLVFDAQMADFAVIEHNPVLTDLESNTTYYYRLQGTGTDGTIYLSEVMTFTTPDFDAMTTDNLASPLNGAKIVGYSSAFGGADIDERWGAGSAFDGNPSTAWSTAGDGDNAWIEIQLAQRARIDRVEFWSRSMSDGSSITRRFTVTTEDGAVYGPFTLESADQSYIFETTIEAERLRFDLIETTGGNTGALEIAVYGTFIE
ncbi:MAG: hypothetical protein CUN55_12325 [Phototrophicales bacterium]|nr:MAG: hypothetical protein CUN55_12325 [Phototrophicales bacterium]